MKQIDLLWSANGIIPCRAITIWVISCRFSSQMSPRLSVKVSVCWNKMNECVWCWLPSKRSVLLRHNSMRTDSSQKQNNKDFSYLGSRCCRMRVVEDWNYVMYLQQIQLCWSLLFHKQTVFILSWHNHEFPWSICIMEQHFLLICATKTTHKSNLCNSQLPNILKKTIMHLQFKSCSAKLMLTL